MTNRNSNRSVTFTSGERGIRNDRVYEAAQRILNDAASGARVFPILPTQLKWAHDIIKSYEGRS